VNGIVDSSRNKLSAVHYSGNMWRVMPLLLLLLSLVTGLSSASSQSFWIDEANSALKAVQPTWHGFLNLMAVERGSDLQMPGYMVALWGWSKILSFSEYGLRSLNILFFLGAQAAFCFSLRASAKERSFVLLAVMVSPFLWSYLDEARPYIMQFCGATLMVVVIWNSTFIPRSNALVADLGVFCLGAIILCASSLLGVIHALFFGLLLLAALALNKRLLDLLRTRSAQVIIAATALVLAGMGAYYFWTLTLGAKASAVGQTSLATLLFAVYELMGFGGLGPGRLELREIGPRSLIPYTGLLALGFLPYLLAGLWLAIERPAVHRSKRIPSLVIGLALAGAFLAIAAVGFLGDFRVVGRHFMPLAPFLLMILGLVWARMWNAWFWRLAVVASLLIFFCSSLNQRFASRFAKDDYRSAAAVAHDAGLAKAVVWWAADPAAANFYGVFPSVGTPAPSDLQNSSPATSSVYFANNRSAEYLSGLPKADVAILSKVDIYDPNGTLRAWMTANGFAVTRTFPAFTIWEKEVKR